MYLLENEFLSARFNSQGCLVSLENKQAAHGNIIDSPAMDSFKMVFKLGENWENRVLGRDQDWQAVQEGQRIEFTARQIRTAEATVDIGVSLHAALKGENLVFTATIDNRCDALVTNFAYPQAGVIKTLAGGKPALLWPNQCGEMYTKIGDVLSGMFPGREEHNTLAITYPGFASMQWMALIDGGQTLYLGAHDPLCHVSELRVQGDHQDKGALTLTIDRMVFVKPGERWQNPEEILKLYTGTWHRGAADYRDWSATWRPHHRKPDWIQDMAGYFLVINKQQYGHEMWPYNTVPALYEMALVHGCDAVGLFGWYDSGHDNQYPDLEVSKSLGGAEVLRQNIKAVQKKGGHVTLYFQGHLIDVTTDFYKKAGHRLEGKSFWGTPYYEQYNKYHNSTFLKNFTRKTFSTSCPSCPEWQQLMRDKADWIRSFGPDGVLYDQIGGMPPYPCFDETHPHKNGKPSLSITQGRVGLLGGIQQRTKELDPEFAFLTEHVTDLYSAYVDCLHGIGSYPSREGDRADYVSGATGSTVPIVTPGTLTRPAQIDASGSEKLNYPELFRFCFPDVIITVRNPAPNIRPRVANYAFTFGFRYEMEIRYQADCEDIKADTWPEWRAYAAAVTALRRKYWAILGRGEYSDELPLVNGNPRVYAKAYSQGDQIAVALWNDTAGEEPLVLDVPGYRLQEFSTITGTQAAMPAGLQPQQVAVALFGKAE